MQNHDRNTEIYFILVKSMDAIMSPTPKQCAIAI